MTKFYSRYSVPPKPITPIGDGSMTCQEFKEECDINNIVKMPNYGINPLKPPTKMPTFGDFSDVKVTDFYEAQRLLAHSVELFEALPSDIRKHFNNDPAALIEFCNDPKNIEEGIKLGIYEKTPSNASEKAVSDVAETGPHNELLDVNVRTDTIQEQSAFPPCGVFNLYRLDRKVVIMAINSNLVKVLLNALVMILQTIANNIQEVK